MLLKIFVRRLHKTVLGHHHKMDCGPSNALKNLNQFNSRDNSLQYQRHQPQGPVHGFRANEVNNTSFNEFSKGEFQSGEFKVGMQPLQPAMQSESHGMARSRHGPTSHGLQGARASWVNDFSKLAINQPQITHFQNIQSQGQSHDQIIETPGIQNVQTPMYQPRFQMNMMQTNMNQTNMNQGFLPTETNRYQTEHQSLHDPRTYADISHEEFENQFQMIEHETSAAPEISTNTQPVSNQSETDKQEFAETAGKIRDHLIQHEKFKHLKFVELMNDISQRQVEISDNGETFVQTHHDTATLQPNVKPTNTSIPLSQQTNQIKEIVNELPDPLSHIKDGDLQGISDPLTAARIISGDQIKMSDWIEDFERQKWQEFDDYRHDDDFH